jgi:hypothetical protein
LRALPPGTVLNVPPLEKDGYAAMLQTLHGRPIATGYTARVSRRQLEHVRALRRSFESGGAEFWNDVQRAGYRSVVVTPEWMAAPVVNLAPLGAAPNDLTIVDLRAD